MTIYNKELKPFEQRRVFCKRPLRLIDFDPPMTRKREQVPRLAHSMVKKTLNHAIFKAIERCSCSANLEANMRILVVAILILLPVQFAKAQSTFSGAGSFTCGTFEKMYRKAPVAAENAYFHWAQGFMSGINVTTLAIHSPSRDLSSMSVKNQRNILLRYCDGHPRAYFYQSAMNLYRQLKPVPPRPKR